jgi:hypothetical protein
MNQNLTVLGQLKKSLRRKPRGQAMVEYSAITYFMLLMLVVGMSVDMFPGKKNLLELFLAAYQVYYDSFYFVLNLPFP